MEDEWRYDLLHSLQAQSIGVTMSEGQTSISIAPNMVIITNRIIKMANVVLSQIQNAADESITIGTLPPPLTANYVRARGGGGALYLLDYLTVEDIELYLGGVLGGGGGHRGHVPLPLLFIYM